METAFMSLLAGLLAAAFVLGGCQTTPQEKTAQTAKPTAEKPRTEKTIKLPELDDVDLQKTTLLTVQKTVKGPLEMVNIKREDVPGLLQNLKDPYSRGTALNCEALIQELYVLLGFLGPDFDLAETGMNSSAAKVDDERLSELLSKGILDFIPNKGLIRYVTGTSRYQKKLIAYKNFGFSRRGYLRGLSQYYGCTLPDFASETTPPPEDISDALQRALALSKSETESKTPGLK